MSSRFISPFYDVGSGIKPPSGAFLFFFETDGVTPKDTFSDQLATPTPNANPVEADSNGVFGNIYITGSYKVTLKDKDLSQIYGLAAVVEVSTGDFDTNVDADVTVIKKFDTEQEFKDYSFEFPDGKVIHLNDRDADFTKITGIGTANTFDIIASTSVNQSIDLIEENERTPQMLGANMQIGTNQTPFMQFLEDWGKENNKPTHYPAGIYEMQTKLVLLRAPQMIGVGGGQGSIRTDSIDPARKLNGTVFYSKVVGDFCVSIEPVAFDFGGRIENITTIGKLIDSDTKIVGHGWYMHNFGWSAQVINFSVEAFTGINLAINYLQDVHFNNPTLLNGGNGANEPMLEFSNNANFVYFNEGHFEESGYILKVRDGTDAPWEVQFNRSHFEVGNYFSGAAASAPNPSGERRYSTPCIFSGVDMEKWSFNNCMFVPCGVVALDADNGGGVDAQPYFIQFNEASGVVFNTCIVEAPTSAVDFLRLETTELLSPFGRNSIKDVRIVQANPTRYCVWTNGTNIDGLNVGLYDQLSSSRLYGIQCDNGLLDNISFSARETATRSEGTLINALNAGTTKLGQASYNLTSNAFNYVSKNVMLTGYGYEEEVITATQSFDMQRYPHDMQIVCNSASPITISDVTNGCIGKKLTVLNKGTGLVTITGTGNIVPTTPNFGQFIAVQFIGDGERFYSTS